MAGVTNISGRSAGWSIQRCRVCCQACQSHHAAPRHTGQPKMRETALCVERLKLARNGQRASSHSPAVVPQSDRLRHYQPSRW
jgi:hypothetical protein